VFGHLSVCLAVVGWLSLLPSASACDTITAKDRIKIETYIKTWYKLPDKQAVTLVDSSAVDGACYRKLVFRASLPAPLLTLYLTPDGKHLVSNVMDLTMDPLAARREKQKEFERLLTDGALLTSAASDTSARLVVFSDFQCPYCKRFVEFMNGLSADERAKLQITYRQLPLNIHPWAPNAAAVSACAALQDKGAFWKLHDFYFAKQQDFSKETLVDRSLEFLGRETPVETNKIRSCLAEKGYQESLQKDEQLAMDLGITATPTIFLNGRRVSIRSVDDLRAAIRSAETENGLPDAAQRGK